MASIGVWPCMLGQQIVLGRLSPISNPCQNYSVIEIRGRITCKEDIFTSFWTDLLSFPLPSLMLSVLLQGYWYDESTRMIYGSTTAILPPISETATFYNLETTEASSAQQRIEGLLG